MCRVLKDLFVWTKRALDSACRLLPGFLPLGVLRAGSLTALDNLC